MLKVLLVVAVVVLVVLLWPIFAVLLYGASRLAGFTILLVVGLAVAIGFIELGLANPLAAATVVGVVVVLLLLQRTGRC